MKLLTAEERLAEPQGVKAVILGPTGIGKTSLMKTLSPAALVTALYVDIEGGDLAIAGLPVASVRPGAWKDIRDLACVIGGPDPSPPPTAPYSDAHYQALVADPVMTALIEAKIVFIDSITAMSRHSFRWAEQQPEAISDRGKKDLRAVYGLHARTMLGALNQFQRARAKSVIFVGILERVIDDFNVGTWQAQIEGAKTGRELPGIVDQVITYQFVDRGNGKDAERTLVCTSPNAWAYPAKDRSGLLAQFEEPDLGALLAKLASTVEPASKKGKK
jgi:hypothetical protein